MTRIVAVCLLALVSIGMPVGGSAEPAIVSHAHVDGLELDPLSPFEYQADIYAAWSPDEYDGRVFTTDAPDLTELPTVHAVYVVPSDLPDRFGEFAAMFQADARQASNLLATLYGRGLRWDERLGDGGHRYVDITFVRSQNPAAVMSLPQLQFSAVAGELELAGLSEPDKKYAVWLDSPSFACGQAQKSDDYRRSRLNANESSSIAIVYRNAARSPGGGRGDLHGGGFCRGRTLTHELGHALGALLDISPHAFDGAHCYDSAEDVMCYKPPALNDTGPASFDYGNDDYWDPAANPALGSSEKLPWWAANLSRFVCPRSGCDNRSEPEY